MAALDRGVVRPTAMEQRQRESPSQHQENNITAAQPTSMTVDPILELVDYQDSLLVLPSITQPILDLSGTMGAFLDDMDYGIAAKEWAFSNFDGGPNKYFNNITDIPFPNPNPPPTTSSPSSLSTELSHRFWRGSSEVSAAIRLQLVEEVASVINLVSTELIKASVVRRLIRKECRIKTGGALTSHRVWPLRDSSQVSSKSFSYIFHSFTFQPGKQRQPIPASCWPWLP